MTLPRKVKEAGEAAEAALQELRDGAKPTKTADAKATPESVETKSATETSKETDPPKTEEINWEDEAKKAIHKFNVLNGKYKAEGDQYRTDIAELNVRLKALESAPKPKADDTDTTGGDDTTGNDVEASAEIPAWVTETYGKDLPAWVKNIAKQTAEDVVKPIADKVETNTKDELLEREQAFFTAITKAHPDWEVTNGLEAFHKFLATEAPGTKTQRQVLIRNAQDNLDPEPIIAQFTEFNTLYGTGEQTRLQTQETPVDTGAAPLPDEGDPESVKESEIQRFYVDVSTGQYKDRPKEIARFESVIEAAHKAGKIIMDLTGPTA